ncbi:MAG: hypothetical protein EOO09_05995 [Chitinophagaceae bacterium]|nr:MAG: hypothetical protein EOO09_05995 [Chitinophagaceae bacterium]
MRFFLLICFLNLFATTCFAQDRTLSIYRKTSVAGNLIENTLVQRKFYDSTGNVTRQQDYLDGALAYTTEFRYSENRLLSSTVSKDRRELDRTVFTYGKCGLPASRTSYVNGKTEIIQVFSFDGNCLLTGMEEQLADGNKWKKGRREIRTHDAHDSLLTQVMMRGKTDTLQWIFYNRSADSLIRVIKAKDADPQEERILYRQGLPSVKRVLDNNRLVSEEHFLYNEKALLVERIQSSSSGLIEKETFTYDSANRLLTRRQYDAGIRETIYEYIYE